MMPARADVKTAEAPPCDEDLIARIAAGDQRAFRALADRYAGLLFSIARRMGFRADGAEDIVQETWLRVWRHAGRWSPKGGASVKTWLCRIAGNLCIDALRKKRHEAGAEIPDVADGAPGAQAGLESRQTALIVAGALQSLPGRQRAALVMFHYEEFSVAEIAAALDTTVKGVEGLLSRARKELRVTLEKQEGVR